jgi:hypothetical protein
MKLTHISIALLTTVLLATLFVSASDAAAQAAAAIPPAITTPDKVDSRIGMLEFKDGAPSRATLETVYDNLDFTYALRTFLERCRGSASMPCARVCRALVSRTTRSSSSPS